MIALAQRLPPSQTSRSQPDDRHRPAPSANARVEAARHDPSDAATLADEVRVGIARLLGRQAAREWFQAEE